MAGLPAPVALDYLIYWFMGGVSYVRTVGLFCLRFSTPRAYSFQRYSRVLQDSRLFPACLIYETGVSVVHAEN